MSISRYYLCALFFIAVTVSFTSALEEETKSLDNFDLHVRQLEEETEPFDDFHHGSPARQDIIIPNNSYLRALKEHQSEKKKLTTVVKKKEKKEKKEKEKNVVKPLVHNAKTEKPYDHEFGRQSSTRTSSQNKNHYVVKSSGGNAVKKSGGKSGKYAKVAGKPKPKASKTNHASRSAGEEGWHAVMSMIDYF